MFRHAELKNPDDFFAPLAQRGENIAYFCRMTEYGPTAASFLRRCYGAAASCGILIDKPIQNPDNTKLSYYNEIMGDRFEMRLPFLTESLKKWLPRTEARRVPALAEAIYDSLLKLKESGKNENVLKNVFIKYMCWLYYRFERILNQLGTEPFPKMLVFGKPSAHALMMLDVLHRTGCDVLLVVPEGEAAYRQADPADAFSCPLPLTDAAPFPPQFDLAGIREEMAQEEARQRLYDPLPSRTVSTNGWLSDKIFSDLREAPKDRGSDARSYCNCFCRVLGAEDKLTYQKELYQLQLDLKKQKRKLLILSGGIEPPTFDEIKAIRRSGGNNAGQIASSLIENLNAIRDPELRAAVRKAFLDLFFEEVGKASGNLNRPVNKAVTLLCWILRYQKTLFEGLKAPELACFLYLGGCRNENEALFCRLLARTPTDVLILVPDLQGSCCLKDPLLHEEQYPNSLKLERFPEDENGLKLGTTAYNAERDLDTLMYGDTGLYRNHQYTRSRTIILQTMYEEIAVLWDQELKYRPNFDVVDDTVHLPVILAKVSGVKDGAVSNYWNGIRALLTPETFVIEAVPRITGDTPNPIRPAVRSFLRDGTLQREKIKAHADYPYGHLREAVQEQILDKLALLLESRLIRGTFENGTEYTVISTVLNLEKDIVRMIQKFDYTRKNPKVIYIAAGEEILSQEDAICAAFLNAMGFDVLFFVPTGYQCVEKYFSKKIVEEHQVGEYLYDLQVPNLSGSAARGKKTLHDFLFNRRNR